MEFVTFDEVKNRLGKTNEELQQMIDQGDLRVFRDGGELKFRKDAIDALAGAPGGAEEESAGDTLMSIDADILFAEEEEQPADSAAETWIAADTEGVFPSEGMIEPRGMEEAMTAPETEPAPLALSPETDESSLGSVLSDEELAVDAGELDEPVIAIDAESGAASVVSAPSGLAPSRTRIVTLVEPPAHHAQFTFMLGLTTVALALAALALIVLLAGGGPGVLERVAQGSTPLILIVSGAVVVGIAALVGYVLDKQRVAREALGG
ncbi:MAG: helix-turn-helix domain-containing protein [Planctomycetes bacterium]|nr:helix-turn-helix domain-containing protein [Planctomycetota bacterium]